MAERVLKTYRCDKALVSAVSAQARARGETVTDVIERAFLAYIQGETPAQSVYTAPVPPPQVAEEAIVPLEGGRACRHPAAAVEDNVCRECGEDVW